MLENSTKHLTTPILHNPFQKIERNFPIHFMKLMCIKCIGSDRHKINGTQHPETDPFKYVLLTFDKDAKATQWRTDFQQMVLKQLNVHRLKKDIPPHTHQNGLKKHYKITSVAKNMEKLELCAKNTVVTTSLDI